MIEILFRYYMFQVLIKKTNEKTAKKLFLLNKYKTVETFIEQLDAFLDNGFKGEADLVEEHFYGKWTTIRNERNKIIHANSICVNNKRATEVLKLSKIATDVLLSCIIKYKN